MNKMKIVTSQEFKEKLLTQVVNRGKSDLSTVSSSVRKIINDVREKGDKALLQYTEKFDKVQLPATKLRVEDRSDLPLFTTWVSSFSLNSLAVTTFICSCPSS